MAKKVFISYPHLQAEWVLGRLVPCLEAGGAEVVIDRDRFAAGKAVVGQMDAIQDTADLSLLVLSPDYLGSGYCVHEMGRAVARDPRFEEGLVIPVVRHECEHPAALTGPNEPLWVDLRDDRQVGPWQLLLSACGADLGCEAPGWLEARDEVRRFLERRQSVNLVVRGRVAWRQLIDQLRAGSLSDLVTVDLQKPSTVSRRGLVAEILHALGAATPVPPEPEDLAVLGRMLEERAVSRVALTHFDLAAHRDTYGINLFSSLRYLLMESRKLVLLVQSHKPFATLLPEGHPLSTIDVKTVELRGRP